MKTDIPSDHLNWRRIKSLSLLQKQKRFLFDKITLFPIIFSNEIFMNILWKHGKHAITHDLKDLDWLLSRNWTVSIIWARLLLPLLLILIYVKLTFEETYML